MHHGKKKESENAKGRLLGKTITITITGCSDDQKLHLGKRKEYSSTTIYVILKIIKSGKYMEENWTIKKLGKNN